MIRKTEMPKVSNIFNILKNGVRIRAERKGWKRKAILKLITRVQFLRRLIFPPIFTTIKQLVNPDYKSSVLPKSIVRAVKEAQTKLMVFKIV